VKVRSRVADRSPRVYYSLIGALFVLLLALVVVAWPTHVVAQVELTWSPSMVKGSPSAPVTIVEFSDYQ
jgi:hypothetical protein